MDDNNIQTTLLGLKNTFFDSLANGSNTLVDFDTSWTHFCHKVSTSAEQLEDDTRSMIYSFAETITAIVPGLLEVESTGDLIRRQLQEDIALIMEKDLCKLTIRDSKSTGESNYSSYIESAHAWLLNNLHNPYPSTEIRGRIARDHHCPRKDVDAWFTDARRRIGWNAIRKSHFPKKADLIAAATLFFKEGAVDSSPLASSAKQKDSKSCYDFLFVDVMVRARSLSTGDYSKLSENTSAKLLSNRDRKLRSAALSYPSPEHSADDSPEPPSPLSSKRAGDALSDSLDTESEADTPGSTETFSASVEVQAACDFCNTLSERVTRKRKLSLDSTSSEHHEKHRKVQANCEWQPVSHLPSPAPSTHTSPTQNLLRCSDVVLQSDPTVVDASRPMKRRRRLSDAGTSGITKRRHTLDLQHFVSDPLLVIPSSDATGDDQFTYSFSSQFPDPVNELNVDHGEPLSIECMSYNFSPSERGLELQSDANLPPIPLPMSHPLPSVDVSAQNIDLGFVSFAEQLPGPNIDELFMDGFNWNIDFDFESLHCRHPLLANIDGNQLNPRHSVDSPSLLFAWSNFSQDELQHQDLRRKSILTDSNIPSITASRTILDATKKSEQIQHLHPELSWAESEILT